MGEGERYESRDLGQRVLLKDRDATFSVRKLYESSRMPGEDDAEEGRRCDGMEGRRRLSSTLNHGPPSLDSSKPYCGLVEVKTP